MRKINVEEALANPDSIFYTYQKLAQIRKRKQLASSSWLWIIRKRLRKSLPYIRKDGNVVFLVITNLSKSEQEFHFNGVLKSILVANTEVQEKLEQLTLAPWDAFCQVWIKLKKLKYPRCLSFLKQVWKFLKKYYFEFSVHENPCFL